MGMKEGERDWITTVIHGDEGGVRDWISTVMLQCLTRYNGIIWINIK